MWELLGYTACAFCVNISPFWELQNVLNIVFLNLSFHLKCFVLWWMNFIFTSTPLPPFKTPGSAPVNVWILENVFLPKCLQYFTCAFWLIYFYELLFQSRLQVKLLLFTAVCRRGLMGLYNEKWLASLFSVWKALITVITAIGVFCFLI